jgi:delta 1-pyrroline-5-carboxylate dehydrogenase
MPREIVGRKPFEGSGAVGPCDMAGGPDYLHRLLDPQVINQRAARRFAPEI